MQEIRRIEIPRFPYPVLCLLLLFCASMDKIHAGETLAPLPAAKSAESFPIGCRQVYAGTVGGSAVEMLLGRNRRETGACFEDEIRTSEPADGKAKLAGYYYYVKTGRIDPKSGRRVFEQLALTGQLDGEGNLDLTESVAGRDTPTGRFRGLMNVAEEIKGTWSDAEGKRSLPFSLRRLDHAAQNGAVSFCIVCEEKSAAEDCHNFSVQMPGEISLELKLLRLQDALEYSLGVDDDLDKVMNSVSIQLLPGNPDLYQVNAFADQQCGVSGIHFGDAAYFFVRGRSTKPVLTFSGGNWSNLFLKSDASYRFNYHDSELKVWGKRDFTCGGGYCNNLCLHEFCPVYVTDIVGDGILAERSLTLQRYRIAGQAAIPLGEIVLQKENILTVNQGEQHSISFVDDGTSGWLELSAEYPFDTDSPPPPRPDRWCWLYAHSRPPGKPSPWHPTMPREALQRAVAIAKFDPAEVEFVTAGTENNDETKNSAVAVWLNGRLLGFVVGAEQTCYSRGVRQAGRWGQPLDRKALNLYRRLFPPPFPETHRIGFAAGHSSVTLHGVVEDGSAALYGVRARKGQTLTVAADAEVRASTIAGRDVRDDDPDPTRVVARLPRGGDYVIQVIPATGKNEFRLTVEIR